MELENRGKRIDSATAFYAHSAMVLNSGRSKGEETSPLQNTVHLSLPHVSTHEYIRCSQLTLPLWWFHLRATTAWHDIKTNPLMLHLWLLPFFPHIHTTER